MFPSKKVQKKISENSQIKSLSRKDLKEFPKDVSALENPSIMYTPEELREMVLEQAKQESEEIKKKAYEEGYEEGKSLAEQNTHEAIENAARVFEECMGKIIQVKSNFLEQITPQILELVFQISEKVISTQIRINPEIISTIVKETLEVLIESQEVNIHVNPEDYSFIQRYIYKRIENGERLQDIIILPDDTVERGGCIAETKTKFVDNQISSRLNLIIEKTINFARENSADS